MTRRPDLAPILDPDPRACLRAWRDGAAIGFVLGASIVGILATIATAIVVRGW